ncbi:MAG: hypothetical protein M5U34_34820 [Chloroflexi bacterium]|nr:hypothetical protein [Chloroflexota bacterium]
MALIIAGYRAFRYGEEVEQIEGKVKKAVTGKNRGSNLLKSLSSGETTDLESIMSMGMDFLEDKSK